MYDSARIISLRNHIFVITAAREHGVAAARLNVRRPPAQEQSSGGRSQYEAVEGRPSGLTGHDTVKEVMYNHVYRL